MKKKELTRSAIVFALVILFAMCGESLIEKLLLWLF